MAIKIPQMNGMRQPHAYRSGCDRHEERISPVAEPSSMPTPTLNGCQLTRNDLFLPLLNSEMNVRAEPNSPPVARPWTRRSTVRRIGARMPTCS